MTDQANTPKTTTEAIASLSFPMMLSLRDLWSQSKLGHVHPAAVDVGSMRPLVRRGMVIQETPLGFTLTPFGLAVVDELEAEWDDHVENQFGDVSNKPRLEQDDKVRALVSMEDRRDFYVKRAESVVARLESQLASAKSAVALLELDPYFLPLEQEGA